MPSFRFPAQQCIQQCAITVLVVGASCATPAEAPTAEEGGRLTQQLADLPQPAGALERFRGTFEHLAIEVPEANESFTVHFVGERLRIEPGAARNAEYTVQATPDEVETFIGFLSDGQLAEDEAARVVAFALTPVTRWLLEDPVPSSRVLRRFVDLDDRMHVALIDQGGSTLATQTVTWDGAQWRVEEGLQGDADRTFTLTVNDAVTYQRRAYSALKANSTEGWRQFASWFKGWRQDVSSPGSASVSLRP